MVWLVTVSLGIETAVRLGVGKWTLVGYSGISCWNGCFVGKMLLNKMLNEELYCEELYCWLEGCWQIWATAIMSITKKKVTWEKFWRKDFVNKTRIFHVTAVVFWRDSLALHHVLSSSRSLHGVWCSLCHTHDPSLLGFLLSPALGKWFSCAAG